MSAAQKENLSIFDPLQENDECYCRTCKHRIAWQKNTKTIQYCGIRSSNRTENGLLKIKAKTPACSRYESESLNGLRA